jgi:4'-phosphopantetheinyl transferase EntD
MIATELERFCSRHAQDRGQEVAAAFVSIAETAELEPTWLGPRERERLAGFRFEKRRRDWLAGRRAAKIALARLLGDEMAGDLDVLPAESGAPVVHGWTGPLPGIGVSLVHSHDLAGALAWRGDGAGPGLDLEHVEPLHEALLALALNASELAYVDHGAEPLRTVRALRLWTAKEAVLKSQAVGLRQPLRSVRVEPVAALLQWAAEAIEPATGAVSAFEVVTEPHGSYVVAVAFPRR